MTDINQMNINQLSYDQQAFKMMTHLWNIDPYAYNSDQKSSAINSFAYFNSLTNPMPLLESAANNQASKRKQKKVPDEEKDDSYYERRKKNNESARRSREQRRRKEEDNAKGLEFLRIENERLRQEMHRLYAEVQRLRGLVGSNQTFGWPAPTS